jgi:hypothetical protein
MLAQDRRFILLIKISLVLLLFARAWQHFFWNIPLRMIFWNESLLSPIVTNVFGMTWVDWASSPNVNLFISFITKTFGVFYLLMIPVVIKINQEFKMIRYTLPLTAAALFFLSFLYYMEKFFYLGMLIEHAIQFGLPLVLYVALFKNNFFQKYLLFFKVLIALTFVGHGLFAIGFYPLPGPFIDMVITVFGANEVIAVRFLNIIGGIDLAASFLLFVPRTQFLALVFTSVWGIATALARIVAHLDMNLALMSVHQWLFEVLARLPHGLLPLAIFLYLYQGKSKIRYN